MFWYVEELTQASSVLSSHAVQAAGSETLMDISGVVT